MNHKKQSQTSNESNVQFKILFAVHTNSYYKKLHPANGSANHLQEN